MKRFRMDAWLIGAVILASLIALIAPQQLGVSLYKLSLIVMAGVVGYWLDRSVFWYARPDFEEIMNNDSRFAYAMQRRAIIMAACIVGMSLGA